MVKILKTSCAYKSEITHTVISEWEPVWSVLCSHQIVVRSNPEELSEVSERHRSVCFKPEVWIVMRRCQITAFTERDTHTHHIWIIWLMSNRIYDFIFHKTTFLLQSGRDFFSKTLKNHVNTSLIYIFIFYLQFFSTAYTNFQNFASFLKLNK